MENSGLTNLKNRKAFKLVKFILIKLNVNIIRDRILKFIRTYENERKGVQLAYSLTHPLSTNFEKEQKKLLFNILNYAKENVPYYKTIMLNLKLNEDSVVDNLKELPLLTKAIIREKGENIYSEQFEKEFSYNAKTGGSTGEPMEFPLSRNFEHVHGRCLYTIMGAKRNETIVAFDGTRIEDDLIKKSIFWTVGGNNFPYGSVHYSTLYMNDHNMNNYIDHLNSVKPSIMRGYPSAFENLAIFLNKNNTKLNFSIKGIYLTAESFDSSYVKLLNEVFKCPVYGQYGHSEVSIFAFTLANSLEYICSPLYGFTEVLDDKGYHVKEGETGEVVVTGYSNKVMPFIRYRTGDIAMYGGTFNGIVRLKSIQGRTADYILNRDNEKIFILAFGFNYKLKSYKKIKKWQIEQNEKGIIIIRIVKDDGFLDSDADKIIELLEPFGVKAIVKFEEQIPLTIRGKQRWVVQNIVN